MAKKKNIADFRSSDGLDPIVMQKLNTNFWNIIEMFEDPEIVAVSSASEPKPHTDEMLWYDTAHGILNVWTQVSPGVWKWQNVTEVVIGNPETIDLITEIAMQAGGDKNYHHDQQMASTTWNIHHGLNKKPSVTVFDKTYPSPVNMECEIIYPNGSNDDVTLIFSEAVSGDAYLN